MDHTTLDRGLTLFRASRLEALLDPLEELLAKSQPEQVLQPQWVIAAHPGMKQWLTRALARRVGSGRIVANLEVLLPSQWLDELAQQRLGQRAVALPRYRRGHLRWTLHAMLGEAERHGIDDPHVLAYLRGGKSQDERALRHFQLADRLAGVLSQYLVYRRDWLADWEQGRNCHVPNALNDKTLNQLESRCLAPLWKAVSTQLGAHRGQLASELIQALSAPGTALEPLHVFGLSHLPPAELAIMQAYARQAHVFMYVPDPCRVFWGGLHAARGEGNLRTPDPDTWQSWREKEAQILADPNALSWHEQEHAHPLLSQWGRLGQHFFAALVEGELREDVRHWKDEETPTPGNRLERLQESLRQYNPRLLAEKTDQPDAVADASLRIHACHTPLRELEVLRDVLLDAIGRRDISASDIVVMAPDIQSYLPLIPAVFGAPGSMRERRLPYHLADVPVARTHPLFGVITSLLNIGSSRITAPEVVDLLGIAEVRRALKLDEETVATLVEWLRSSRVAWALDGAHKQAMQLPPRSENSFAWAMDRLLAGYLMADSAANDDPDLVALPDGTKLLPVSGIDGPSSAALGALDRLLCELQAWRELAQEEHPASQWAEWLRTRVDALLSVAPDDRAACAALAAVQRAIASLASEPQHNGSDPVLRLSVVREILQDALASVPDRQRFLMGGITFCGMVPQRAVPFKVVCVLGLNEGAFPRRPADGGIDLMTRLRRVGDRDVPSDDRYLFLETLMSARQQLHLSYIGQGVRDGKPRNPAAPLAELMAELDRHAGNAPDKEDAVRPWLIRHPLQPFDARYFDGSHPALFSYSEAFAHMHGDGHNALKALRDCGLPAHEPLPDPIPLSSLEAFFRNPARALMRDHLQISLDALDNDARLQEEEPMESFEALHTVARNVFLRHVLPRLCADPDGAWDGQPPAWVAHGGLLPVGLAGESAWQREALAVDSLLVAAKHLGRFDERCAQTIRLDVSLPPADDTSPALRITGTLRQVYALRGTQQGLQLVFAFPDSKKNSDSKKKESLYLKDAEDLTFRDLVPAFLHWALLRLQQETVNAPVRLTFLAKGEPVVVTQANQWDEQYCTADASTRAEMASKLRRRVRALVTLWCTGRDGLSYFYPKTGWAAISAKPERDEIIKKTGKAWFSDYGSASGERDQDLGYTRMLEGELQFGHPESDPENRALGALLADARQVEQTILMLGKPADEAPRASAGEEVE